MMRVRQRERMRLSFSREHNAGDTASADQYDSKQGSEVQGSLPHYPANNARKNHH